MYRSRISYVINLTITLIAWRLYSTHGVLFICTLHEWNKMCTALNSYGTWVWRAVKIRGKNTKTTAFQKIINAFIWVSHEKHNAQLKNILPYQIAIFYLKSVAGFLTFIATATKGKVRTFWEAHKNLQSSSCFAHLLSKHPNHEEDFFSNFVCFSESPNIDTDFQLILEPLESCF